MKKKLTAILLTLCMVLGMLPMSALAAWYHGETEVTLNGNTVDVDDSTYYILDQIPSNPKEGDTLDYYRYYAENDYQVAGQLTWKADSQTPEQEFNITNTITGQGTVAALVSGKEVTKAAEGTQVTLDPRPAQDYKLTSLVVMNGDREVDLSNNYQFTMPGASVNVIAVFTKNGEEPGPVEPESYGITVTKTGDGEGDVTVKVNGAEASKASKDDRVTVEAVAKTGSKLVSVKSTTEGVTLDVDEHAVYSFTMPAKAVALIVTFEEKSVQVEVTPPTVPAPDEDGKVTTETTVDKDKLNAAINTAVNDPDIGKVTIDVNPKEGGDKVTDAKVDLPAITIPAGKDAPDLEVKTPVADVILPSETVQTLTAGANLTVSKDKVTVDGVTDELPTVSVALTDKTGALIDTEVTVTVPAPEGAKEGDTFVFAYKDDNGVWQTATALVANGMIDWKDAPANQAITILTEQQAKDAGIIVEKHKVVIGAHENGTLTANPAEAAAGEKVIIKAVPDEGFHLVSITVDSKTILAADLDETDSYHYYELTMGNANIAISAVFEKDSTVVDEYTISFGTPEHGTVSAKIGETDVVEGQKYAKDSTVVVTAQPASGYRISTVTVNGEALKAVDGIYSFVLTADSEISATFARIGGGGGGGGGGSSGISHSVNTNVTKNGSVRVSPSSAAKGEKVTITVTPNDGYVLDTLVVKDANGKEVTLTKVNDTTYTFIMPETAVTVDATYKLADGSEAGEGFSDVAKDYTFYDDITWVAGKGYMQGYEDGTFRPTANTTRQALWMVLARMDGANPADMAAARAWAMEKGITDGTNPSSFMSRQQMVAMLYRYAQLKSYKLEGSVSLDTYPDVASVADYAKDAMSWAVGNGIVKGTDAGTLNPTGTATRAHFAAFLHRFCQTVGIA